MQYQNSSMAKPEYVSNKVDYGHSKKEAVESKIAPFWALKKASKTDHTY